MGIDKTETLLNKFDYKYHRVENELTIKMDFSQEITVDFSNPEKIIIKDKLLGWNFLTGIIEMSLKNAVIYNSIGALIVTFFIVYLNLEFGVPNLILFFLGSMIWMSLWTVFYIAKSENLKRILISWNE